MEFFLKELSLAKESEARVTVHQNFDFFQHLTDEEFEEYC